MYLLSSHYKIAWLRDVLFYRVLGSDSTTNTRLFQMGTTNAFIFEYTPKFVELNFILSTFSGVMVSRSVVSGTWLA